MLLKIFLFHLVNTFPHLLSPKLGSPLYDLVPVILGPPIPIRNHEKDNQVCLITLLPVLPYL